MLNHKLNNKLPKIGFRVDAGNSEGTGHLMEVVSLIHSIRKRTPFSPVVLTKYHPFTVEKLKQTDVAMIRYITGDKSEDDEAKEIITILEKEECTHLILDLLSHSNKYYSYLKHNLTTTCVILDNDEHKEIDATISANFSITQKVEFYEKACRYNTKYLIGTDYFIVNDSIKNIKPIQIKEKVENIFVNQGGSDPYGLTAKIIRAIEKICYSTKVNIIIGGALKDTHREEIDALKHSLSDNFHFYTDIPQPLLYEIMHEADFAISAAGNTLYELAYMGVPTLIISHHEKHDKVAKAFKERGAAVNMGIGTNLSESEIGEKVENLLNNCPLRVQLNQNARKIIDGYGTDRIVDELTKLY